METKYAKIFIECGSIEFNTLTKILGFFDKYLGLVTKRVGNTDSHSLIPPATPAPNSCLSQPITSWLQSTPYQLFTNPISTLFQPLHPQGLARFLPCCYLATTHSPSKHKSTELLQRERKYDKLHSTPLSSNTRAQSY